MSSVGTAASAPKLRTASVLVMAPMVVAGGTTVTAVVQVASPPSTTVNARLVLIPAPLVAAFVNVTVEVGKAPVVSPPSKPILSCLPFSALRIELR